MNFLDIILNECKQLLSCIADALGEMMWSSSSMTFKLSLWYNLGSCTTEILCKLFNLKDTYTSSETFEKNVVVLKMIPDPKST